MLVGILALQGCITPHKNILEGLGATVVEVRNKCDLQGLQALILPGGESTTMLRLLATHNLTQALKKTCSMIPVWGICAGSILLAEEVENPTQESLMCIAIKAKRNAYGPQTRSFTTSFRIRKPSDDKELEVTADFIRAPQLIPLSPAVEILGTLNDEPIMLREANVLATSFHVELRKDNSLHSSFLEWAKAFNPDKIARAA